MQSKWAHTHRYTHIVSKASLTCVVGQPFVVCVKQEPSLLPRLDPPTSFRQKARTATRCEPQISAAGNPVTQWLHMGPKVKVWSKEKWQAALLKRHVELKWPFDPSTFHTENASSQCHLKKTKQIHLFFRLQKGALCGQMMKNILEIYWKNSLYQDLEKLNCFKTTDANGKICS